MNMTVSKRTHCGQVRTAHTAVRTGYTVIMASFSVLPVYAFYRVVGRMISGRLTVTRPRLGVFAV